jgi:TolB protein
MIRSFALQIALIVAFILSSRAQSPLHYSGEDHLRNIRQLTFGGQNAEAYFSPDGKRLVFQSQRDSFPCDQIFMMNIDGTHIRLLSTGKGRTTCSFFLPDGGHILYASTHLADPACPPPPDRSKGYVWQLFPGYDIVTADTMGTITGRLTSTHGYDAEAVVSPKGDRIAFTSVRNGDLDIYTMNLDGSDVRQLTHEIGYDGGPFFSPDGKKIIYRAYHPSNENELKEYRALLAEGKIRPFNLQIWVMDADGSHKQQLTFNTGTNFAPFFHPDGKQVIFSSNMEDTSAVPMNFDLYLMNLDGSNIRRITSNPTFDGFPMFSPDGTTLVFASNRNATHPHETNVFICDWVP